MNIIVFPFNGILFLVGRFFFAILEADFTPVVNHVVPPKSKQTNPELFYEHFLCAAVTVRWWFCSAATFN